MSHQICCILWQPCSVLLRIILLCALASCSLQKRLYPIAQVDLPPGAYCCEVNETRLWTKQLQGLGPAQSALLRPLLNYKFLLPEKQLRAGLSYYGSPSRLRRFVSDLLAGRRQLKIGVVGGSISWGASVKKRNVDDWFSIFSKWVTSVAKANVTARNGAVAGTPSAYMELCLHNYVDEDIDLLFVEYVFNDGDASDVLDNPVVMTVERLLRRIMDLPGRPAVVLMQVPHLNKVAYEPFYDTCEDLEGALSAYYDIPAVSSRTALYQLAVTYAVPGWEWTSVYQAHHPGNAGHKAMADLAVHLIQTAALDLVHVPLTAEERAASMTPLPAPMYQGNVPPADPKCLVGEAFKHLAVAAEGWEWVNEGTDEKPKWGFVSHDPGSELLVRFDTAKGTGRADSSVRVHVIFYYLKSYTPMGMALFECVAGCECDPVEVNAWAPDGLASQPHVSVMEISQAPRCDVRVTVMNETKCDGHKFKVVGIVVSDWTKQHGSFGYNSWVLHDP